MTVEDRIRAATRARVELVRDIRPLEVQERVPRRAFRVPRSRRLIGWLAPVTAAAVVVVLAIALVAVRQDRNPGTGPAPVTPASAAAIPRYYVSVSPGLPGGSPAAAIVADSRTGTVLARVQPPAHREFGGVTGAADDRTFVMDTIPVTGHARVGAHAWYLLRVVTGPGHRASLTRLPIPGPAVSAQVQGLALSPDGSTLAVLFQRGTPGSRVLLRTYSVATGQGLRTWIAPAPKASATVTPGIDNLAAVSWVGEHVIAFRFPVLTWPDFVRFLNTTSKSSDLLKASRPVLTDPGDQHNCATLLTATDGKTVACGTLGNATGGCVNEEPVFDLWSTATGKVIRLLYRYSGTCQSAVADILWAGHDGTMIGAIAAYTGSGKHIATTYTLGLIAHGKFTPLRFPAPQTAPGDIAF